MPATENKSQLRRDIRTPGAILMGLGSIVGTGIFVSIAIATQVAGSGIILAIGFAALLATFNGLSSAQLAAAHPVSGGTYEYGYRYLNSWFGFTAGWMFLVAKSASAATAVLGCIGYLMYAFDIQSGRTETIFASLVLLFIVTWLVSGGIRRSNTANKIIVIITLVGLSVFVLAGLFVNGLPLSPLIDSIDNTSWTAIFYASALMFVAYTGYGRIATLGEEVAEPRKTIPRAIILAMICIVILYLAVSLTVIHSMGATAFGETLNGDAAPLMVAAQVLAVRGVGAVITIAAITAMLGVLLNLLLGLSRVLLGMARRGDVFRRLSEVRQKDQSPAIAVWTTGGIIAVLVLSGDVIFTWSFSAFTVLIYYAITNLSALMLPAEDRLYSRFIRIFGLVGCLFLAFIIESGIWIPGLICIGVGLIWHYFALRKASLAQ